MKPVLVIVWLLLGVCSAQRTQNRSNVRITSRSVPRSYQTSPRAAQNRTSKVQQRLPSTTGQNRDRALYRDKVTRYIESYFMVDQLGVEQFRRYGFELVPTINEMITLTNSLFLDLNMWLVLNGLEIWNESRPWPVTYTYQIINGSSHINTSATSRILGEYRLNVLMKQRALKVDHIHLLTGDPIAVDKRPAIGAGPYDSMCSIMSVTIVSVPQILENQRYGKGYNKDALAILLAHEIGHTLNLSHDVNGTEQQQQQVSKGTPSCTCSDGECVMWPSAGHKGFEDVKWTDCRKRQLTQMSKYPRDVCLTNIPSYAVPSEAKCGDFVLTRNEQCDCGPRELCARDAASRCCNASTCQLRDSAYRCASGRCCNLSSCNFAEALAPCRPSKDECDLPEYCTGAAANCPEDTWKADGTPCATTQGFCYKGTCKFVEKQCKAMFGSAAHARRMHENRSATCFTYTHCTYILDEVLTAEEKNKTGYDLYECNFNNFTHTSKDYGCTQLACETDRKTSSECETATNPLKAFLHFSVLDDGLNAFGYGSSHCCHFAAKGPDFDLSVLSAQLDMRLIEDGTKCGPSSMCYNQTCQSIENLEKLLIVRQCRQPCPAATVCNNKGECQKLETSEVLVTAPDIKPPTTESSTTVAITVINERDSLGIMERLTIIIIAGFCVSLLLTGSTTLLLFCCCRRKRPNKRNLKTQKSQENSRKPPCSFSGSPKSKRYSTKANVRPTGLPICTDGEKQCNVMYATEDEVFL